MNRPTAPSPRRLALRSLAGAAACVSFPTLTRAALPPMTEGPFYPSPAYRARQLDWDADLTRVTRSAAADAPRAAGEWLDLTGAVLDARGRPVDGADIEIWQCDVYGSYRHPRGAGAQVDEAFQGFGSSRTDAQGRYRFRTIKPVVYPGRAPHIHVLLRHPTFGERVSQLFVAADPANARDFIYRSLSASDRHDTELRLQRAPVGSPVVWQAERSLLVGG